MRLSAVSISGKTGESAPIEMTLPQRLFHNPLARSLVEQRRNLILDPDHAQKPVEAALTGLGFQLREHLCDHCPPGCQLEAHQLEKRFYKHLDPVINLHVRAEGRFNQRYALLFRDYLRAVPMARDAYAEIKRQLARYFPEDLDAYYDLKDPVCDVIMAGAFDWADRHGWAPGPSDA